MFGRKKDAEGFYTGDAPASAPGFDGAEPTAYTGMPGVQQTPGQVGGAQPGAAQVDPAQLLDQVLARVPGFVDAPPGQQPAPPGTPPPSPQFSTAGTLDPATAARVQAALATSPKTGKLGLVILIPVIIAALGGLVGIGVAIFAATKASSAVSDVFSSVEMPTAIAPEDAAGEPAGEPVAEPASEPAAVVTAEYDEPALAEISRPDFTVAIGQPEVIKKKDPRAIRPPETGRYLVFPVTFAGVEGAQGLLDIVDADRFVLVLGEGDELTPTFAGVAGSISLAAVSADEPATGLLAFDTRAKGGTLQLRDDADQVMIEWSVGAAK